MNIFLYVSCILISGGEFGLRAFSSQVRRAGRLCFKEGRRNSR